MKRRNFLSMLAATPLLMLPHRSIFLPPNGGWISPIETFPYDLHTWKNLMADQYQAGIAAGKYTYDESTQLLSLWRYDDDPGDGKFHSVKTGRIYDWLGMDEMPINRAAIDDALDRLNGPQKIVQTGGRDRSVIPTINGYVDDYEQLVLDRYKHNKDSWFAV